MSARPAVMILLGMVALGSAREEPLPREQLYTLLNEASVAFQQANTSDDSDRARKLYDQAILLYEKIIARGGVENAGLYYNLANAYLLSNDLGRAILNYRRAERLDGADLNIRKNLAFARSRRIDRIDVGAEKRVLDTLFFWHYDFALRTKMLLACLFFAVLCLVLTAMIWLGRGPATMTITVLALVLLLCLVASSLIESHRQATLRIGVVLAPEIVARQGDGPNYPPSFTDPLHAGTEFELLEQRPGWLHIRLSDGTDAWVPDDAAGIV